MNLPPARPLKIMTEVTHATTGALPEKANRDGTKNETGAKGDTETSIATAALRGETEMHMALQNINAQGAKADKIVITN